MNYFCKSMSFGFRNLKTGISMSSQPEKFVNVVPFPKLKREVVEDDLEDMVYCRICTKGFLSSLALSNHARMEHIDAYASGDPRTWTEDRPILQKYHKLVPNSKLQIDKDKVKIKTEEILSSLEPTSIMSLASNDVSYIIIKAEDGPISKRKRIEKTGDVKVRVIEKKPRKELQAISGPFECLRPSTTMGGDGICHQIFFSCCEYSVHYRDEHTRRRKGLRCQVCEKPLACTGEDMAPYSCEVCGLGFLTGEELTQHSATAHVKLKPYKCNICHKRFTQQGGVLQHMRMHTGDRPFPCTFCPKSFTQKSGLDQHLRIHTKVKPYRCVVCSKSFCQSVHLKQHMRTHTNVAPFQCGICEKRFKQSSHLNYHLKNHNPASMTEEQKAKYAELIGMIAKDVVEIEIDQNQSVEMDGMEVQHQQGIDTNSGTFGKEFGEESWGVVNNC